MKHFNNSLDGNVNLSNIPDFKPDYSPKTESFFVTLLILIGIAGAIYTFNVGFKTSLPTGKSLTKNMEEVFVKRNFAPTAPSKNIIANTPSVEQLTIAGEKEANQSLLITIESFNANANYILNMGDNKIVYPKKKTFAYTYDQPGNYTIQLDVNFRGQSKRIYSKNIEIFQSIAVAPGALNEY